MEQYQTIVLQIIIFRLMNKLGEVAMPTQNTNYHITAIASALATCLDRSVEVGKISEMTLCLLRLGVSNYSPWRSINGEANYRIHKLENQIFYLPSSTTPFILDMESNILLGKSPPAEFLDIINTLGLGVIIKDSCENLSTGEQLRVAMARGLISKKNIFLLDEFNANLDNKTSDQIVQMLLKKAKNGALIILVNHKSSIPGAIILELGL